MKRSKRAASCLGAALFLSAAAVAEVLTWEAAAREAARGNPELSAAREVEAAARARWGARKGDFFPQVSASAGIDRSGTEGSAAQTGTSAGISARQDLFSGFSTRAAVARAAADWRQAAEVARETEARVAYELSAAHARLLYAQEQETVAAAIEARRRENVRLVGLRFEAGRENKGALLRARAAHRQASYELSQARRARRTARRELARVLGRNAFEDLEAGGFLSAPLLEAFPDMDVLADGTSAVRRAEEKLVSAKASVLSADSRFWPALFATGGMSCNGTAWPPDRDRWSAGIGLSYPLFSGGGDRLSARAARADREAAAAELSGARRRAAADLEEAFASLQDAAERVGVQEAFLEAGRMRAEISRRQYENGLANFDDWDIIENDLISQEKAALAARRDAVLARAAWDRELSKGLP